MTRDEFVNHVLAACGCEFRDGKIWFEKEELIECADDLYFKNPKYQSEDYISRKALMIALIDKGLDHIQADDLTEINQIVADLPSIQPKPMQVDLEGDGYADNGQIYYDYGKCPKCGWDFEDGDKDWEEPYCCHCGQKLHWFESEE